MKNLNDEKKEFSKLLNLLWRNGEFKEAKELLLNQVNIFPFEYFLWTSLAQTCSGLCEYKMELEYSTKAINLCKNDVLVIYNHIGALEDNGFYQEALPYCQKILRKTIKEIALTGESIKWAKSIRNDTLFLKAVSLFNIGEYEKTYRILYKLLKQRQRGIYSDFSKKQICELIKKTLQLMEYK